MERCPWRRLAIVNKDVDRIVSVDAVAPDGTTETLMTPVAWERQDDGTLLIAGRAWPPGTEFVNMTLEPGDTYETFRVCLRRAGHRGLHGVSPWRHPLRAARRWWRSR